MALATNQVANLALKVPQQDKTIDCRYETDDAILRIIRCDDPLARYCDLNYGYLCFNSASVSFGETVEDITTNCYSLQNVRDRTAAITYTSYCPPCFDPDTGEANLQARLDHAYGNGVPLIFQYITGAGDGLVGYGTATSPTLGAELGNIQTWGMTLTAQQGQWMRYPKGIDCLTGITIKPTAIADGGAGAFNICGLSMPTGYQFGINNDLVTLGLGLNSIISGGNDPSALLFDAGTNFTSTTGTPIIMNAASTNCCIPSPCSIVIKAPDDAALLGSMLTEYTVCANFASGATIDLEDVNLAADDAGNPVQIVAGASYQYDLDLSGMALSNAGLTDAQAWCFGNGIYG